MAHLTNCAERASKPSTMSSITALGMLPGAMCASNCGPRASATRPEPAFLVVRGKIVQPVRDAPVPAAATPPDFPPSVARKNCPAPPPAPPPKNRSPPARLPRHAGGTDNPPPASRARSRPAAARCSPWCALPG